MDSRQPPTPPTQTPGSDWRYSGDGTLLGWSSPHDAHTDTTTTSIRGDGMAPPANAPAPIRLEEIVLVVERGIAPTQEDGASTATAGYEIFCLQEEPTHHGSPFQLRSTTVRDVPHAILTHHLVTKEHGSGVRHLACHAHHHLHVVVSTGSGTGQAEAFYRAVLQPLLSALGVHPAEGEARDANVKDAPDVAAAVSAEKSTRTQSGAAAATTTASGLGLLSSPPQGTFSVTMTRDAHSVRTYASLLKERRAAEASAARLATPGDRGDTPPAQHTIILLSGDGGVVDLLNGLYDDEADSTAGYLGDQHKRQLQPRCTIALLPLGTGNALFHSLHKPLYRAGTTDAASRPSSAASSPFVLGLRTLFRGTVAPLPSFRASFSPGSRLVLPGNADAENSSSSSGGGGSSSGSPAQDTPPSPSVDFLLGAIVASYGLHASLVWESDTPAMRAHGAARFGMAAERLLETNHGYRADVEVVRAEQPGHGASPPAATELLPPDAGSGSGSGSGAEFGYVLATLVSNLERTFAISPASRPLDGQLRLVHFGPLGAARTMEIMRAAYDGGRHVGFADVGYEEDVQRVKVAVRERDPRWRKVCVDGTIVEIPEGGWMAVESMKESVLDVVVDRSLLE